MLKANDVAKFMLSLEDQEAGDTISNLKLQKLLYYAQGFHLALFDKPLFEERVLAWTHGPVVREVWESYREHGSAGIPIPSDVNFDLFDGTTADFLKEIHRYFGQFSAWKLRNMTHEESPWVNTERNDEIPHAAMKTFFETQVKQKRA